MGDAFWTPAGFAVWGPPVGCFFAGVFVGWLIWGGRRTRLVREGEPPTEIAALQSHIRTARDALDEQEAESEAFSRQLSALEATVRRAHARLKQALTALRRSSGR